MIKQIWSRLQLLASSGTVTLIGGGKAQVQILDEEVLNNIKLVTPFGYAHKPKAGSQAYIMFPAGDRSFGIALIVGDDRYQFDVAEGEVALHDGQGNHVYIKNDGAIEVKSSVSVTIDAPTVKTTGNVEVTGNITATGSITGG